MQEYSVFADIALITTWFALLGNKYFDGTTHGMDTEAQGDGFNKIRIATALQFVVLIKVDHMYGVFAFGLSI